VRDSWLNAIVGPILTLGLWSFYTYYFL